MDGGPGTQAIVRQHVDELLSSSPALQALPDDRRQAIVQATVKVAQFIVGGVEAPAASGTMVSGATHSVDFPEFVRGLIDGVFRAIVDGSIEQMEAYGELVARVADQIPAGDQTPGARDTGPGREAAADAILAGISRIATTEAGKHQPGTHAKFRPSEP
jgi:hypothetical protein